MSGRLRVGVGVQVELALYVPVLLPDDPPALERHDPPDRRDDLLAPVRRHGDGRPRAQELRDAREQVGARGRVEAVARLVEQEELRARDERPREQDAPPLAARELEHGAPEEVLDAERRGHVADARRLRGRRRLRGVELVVEARADHRLDGQLPVVPHVGVLRLGRDEREPLAHADRALGRPVRAVEEPPPGARRVGPELAPQQPQQRGLPGAARAHDRDALPAPDPEGDAVEEGRAAEPDVDAIEGDEGIELHAPGVTRIDIECVGLKA